MTKEEHFSKLLLEQPNCFGKLASQSECLRRVSILLSLCHILKVVRPIRMSLVASLLVPLAETIRSLATALAPLSEASGVSSASVRGQEVVGLDYPEIPGESHWFIPFTIREGRTQDGSGEEVCVAGYPTSTPHFACLPPKDHSRTKRGWTIRGTRKEPVRRRLMTTRPKSDRSHVVL